MVKNLCLFVIALLISIIGTGQIVINEFCSTNQSLTDEDKDTPDWLELYNYGSNDVNIFNYSLTDDSTLTNKWLLPNISLAPKQAILLFASGKDRKSLTQYINLVNHGDNFAYAIGSESIPTNWKTLGFDDSSWLTGPSGFGYGDDDDATIVGDGTISVFVRKVVSINNINDLVELILHLDYDDGFVAYLNGVEIARANLGTPNTDVPYNQTADVYIEPFMTQGLAPVRFGITNFKDIVNEGDNVLSIQVHNNSNTSSDLTLIPFLSAGYSSSQVGNPVPDILELSNSGLHTNFKIASAGEKVFLFDNTGQQIDRTDSILLKPDVSFGRLGNNYQNWVYFSPTTPGATNANSGYTSLSSEAIIFSKHGGKYNSSVQVSLSTSSGNNIYYTTDGTIPTESSNLYSNPINISTSTTIIANTFSDNTLSVSPSIQTYIIENRNFTTPIISLTMKHDDLWDWETGIYVMGPNAQSGVPYFGANFWMDWEKPVHFEYFNEEGNKEYSANCGTKIFGAWSRANDLKSMALFARKEYGNNSFDFAFFENKDMQSYKSLVLRNAGNDIGGSYFRDALMTGLMKNVDIEIQAYKPTTVYLNNEYWGMLNLREKVNEDFLANNHNHVNADKVDILELDGVVVEGTSEHYINMLNYIRNNNISSTSVYDSVGKLMDISNFIEYQVAQIYFDNTDWPGNNIKFWRPQHQGGKWRWILYDTDFGFGIYNSSAYHYNTLDFVLNQVDTKWSNPEWSTYLLRRLLENSEFKTEFINRFADRLNYTFKPSVVVSEINSMAGNIENEVPYHQERWQNLWDFDGHIHVMKDFANQRPAIMREHINEEFSLNNTYTLIVDVTDENAGTIQVNSLSLNVFPWNGKYFKNNPITVSAIAFPGYEFSHWEEHDSTDPVIVSKFSGTTRLTAVFKETSKEYSAVVINEINYKSDEAYDSGDWIELYNPSDFDIDLSNWLLSNNNDTTAYRFNGGTVIPKNGYIVICRNQSKFSKIYPNVQNIVGELNYGLSSTYDMLLLYNPSGVLIDSVLYQNENPWPSINSNQTISLINPLSDNSLGYRWDGSEGIGTPGAHNEYFNAIEEINFITEIEATCFPNPVKEKATIRWKVNTPQNVRINIFDIEGRLVKQIFDNYCPSGTFEEVWYTGESEKAGIYFVRLVYSDGISKTIKLAKY